MKKKFLSLFVAGCFLLVGGMAFAGQDDLVGSKKSDKYHLATCPIAKQISADNLVKFKSPEEAIKAGYSPCQKCNPPTKTSFYVGSKNSAVYHLPTCPLAKKITADNLVKFASKAEAAKAGYKPCQVCLAAGSADKKK